MGIEHLIRMAAQSPDVFLVTDSGNAGRGHQIVYVNAAFTALTGYELEEVAGKSPAVLQGPKTDPGVLSHLREALRSGSTFNGSTTNYRKDGSEYVVEWSITPFRNEQGEVTHFWSVQRDVTKREQDAQMMRLVAADLQGNLKATSGEVRRLAAAFEATEQGLAILRAGRYEYINASHAAIYGYTPDELIGRSWEELYDPETRDWIMQSVMPRLNVNKPWRGELRGRRRDGSPVHCDLSLTVSPDGDLICSCTCIDERKRIEEQARTAAEELNDIYQNAPCGHHSLDPEGRYIRVNRRECDWLGYTAQELIGRNLRELVKPDEQEAYDAARERYCRDGYLHDHPLTLVRKNGSTFPALLNCSACFARDGRYLYSRSTLVDLSQLHRALEDQREIAGRLELAADYCNIGTWTLLPDRLQEVQCDRVLMRIFGEPERTKPFTFPELLSRVHPEDRPLIQEGLDLLAAGGMPEPVTYRFIRADGSVRFLRTATFPRSGTRKNEVRGINWDVTEAVQVESSLRRSRDELNAANRELLRASRMKDEFLASMSHELRTPLNSILGLSEALLEEVYGSLTDRQSQSLRRIEESGRHLLELINDILDLAKIESGRIELQTDSFSAAELCQRAVRMVEELARRRDISLSLSNLPDLTINGDERYIKQAVVNLLSNALKFTPSGGRVSIGMRHQSGMVEIDVADTGIGIDPVRLNDLFRPFVQLDSSLSREHSGTGLGLSLVRRIAELHGGTVRVNSRPGEGSTFTLVLPPEQVSAQERAITTEQGMTWKGWSGRALVIDDSNDDRILIGDTLTEFGATVVTTGETSDILKLAQRFSPDVIILDLLMGDTSGWEILDSLSHHPQLSTTPVVICSVLDRRPNLESRQVHTHLRKPCSRGQILKAVAGAVPHLGILPGKAPRQDSAPVSTGRRAVLIAEDNEANIEMLAQYLEAHNYHTLRAANGQEAVAMTKEHRPALVLMDIQMPGMDGLEAIRLIRCDENCNDIPIIALTGLAMPGDQHACFAAGAEEYISKPYSLKELREVIDGYTKGGRSRAGTARNT